MDTMTDQLSKRLDRIESMLIQLTSSLEMAPAVLSMMTDTVDEIAIKSATDGISLEERFKAVGGVISRLSEPNTTKNIHKLLDILDQAPGLVSMVTDTIDEFAKESAQSGTGLDERINGLICLFNKLSDPEMVAKIDTMILLSNQMPGLIAMVIDSIDEVAKGTDLLGPQNMELLKSAMIANQYASAVEPAKVGGLFGIMKILKDEDIQKMLGFLVNFAKVFGREINKK